MYNIWIAYNIVWECVYMCECVYLYAVIDVPHLVSSFYYKEFTCYDAPKWGILDE